MKSWAGALIMSTGKDKKSAFARSTDFKLPSWKSPDVISTDHNGAARLSAFLTKFLLFTRPSLLIDRVTRTSFNFYFLGKLALILSVVTLSTIMLSLWKVEELSMMRTVLQPPFQRSRMISHPDQAPGLTFLGRAKVGDPQSLGTLLYSCSRINFQDFLH